MTTTDRQGRALAETLPLPISYAVLVNDAPYIIQRSKYENGNPKLVLFTPDESRPILTLTRDFNKFDTRCADADYAFKRIHALLAPNPEWVEALIHSRLIRLTGDAIATSNGIYAYVAHLLFT